MFAKLRKFGFKTSVFPGFYQQNKKTAFGHPRKNRSETPERKRVGRQHPDPDPKPANAPAATHGTQNVTRSGQTIGRLHRTKQPDKSEPDLRIRTERRAPTKYTEAVSEHASNPTHSGI